MRRLRVPFSLAVLCSFGCAETPSVDADRGADATLQVEGGQFVRKAMPDPNGGPEVQAVLVTTDRIRPGQLGKACNGSVGTTGTAAILSLEGDVGYWIVPTGVGDVETPTLPSFRTRLSFARSLTVGEHSLVVRASDAEGKIGPSFVRTLTVDPTATAGALTVRLAWSSDADLDLHVVDPTGVEIWKRDINSLPIAKPGEFRDADAWREGGVLDFDSNAACVIDGRREENVTWQKAAPSGHYVVRVDTASLCKVATAHWTVEARLANGTVLGGASGTSIDSDTRFNHGLGGGLLALEFDVP